VLGVDAGRAAEEIDIGDGEGEARCSFFSFIYSISFLAVSSSILFKREMAEEWVIAEQMMVMIMIADEVKAEMNWWLVGPRCGRE
jgi:hypothetical protein